MAFDTILDARNAMVGWFNTLWLAAYPVNTPLVLWQDVKEDVPTTAIPWLRIVVQHRVNFQATLNSRGNRRFRNRGVLIVEVRTPLGDGLTASDGLVNNVQDIFEGQLTAPDAVYFRDVVPAEVGPDGMWYLVKVTVNFEYDRIH